MMRITDTVKHLIIINVLLFLAAKYAYPPLQDLFALHFPSNPNFGVWQYLTSIFMHSQQSIMHIAFNMFGLWMFGSPLEQMWGRNKFLFFYFSAGIGAGLIYTFVNYLQFNSAYEYLINSGISVNEFNQIMKINTQDLREMLFSTENILKKNDSLVITDELIKKIIDSFSHFNGKAVGASGAIYGILVAFGMSFPNAKLALIFFPVPIAAKYFIPVLLALDLFSGVTGFSIFGQGIAHFAHIGGAIIGFIIMWYWKKNQFTRWDR